MAQPDTPFNKLTAGINPNPCTPVDTQANWGNILNAVNTINNQIGGDTITNPLTTNSEILTGLVDGNPTNIISALTNLQTQITAGGGGVDTYKVKVNMADGPDYLEDQWRDGHVEASAQYTASQDLLVEVDTVDVAGDKKCRLYIDVSDVTGWDVTLAVQQMLTFAVTTGFATMVEAGQIKVATLQTLKFVGAAFEQTGTFASATDLKTYEETIGATPNKSMRVFSRFSDISGWNASNKQVLWNDGGTIKWMDAGATAGTKTETVVTDVSWDTGTCVMTKTTDSIRIFND